MNFFRHHEIHSWSHLEDKIVRNQTEQLHVKLTVTSGRSYPTTSDRPIIFSCAPLSRNHGPLLEICLFWHVRQKPRWQKQTKSRTPGCCMLCIIHTIFSGRPDKFVYTTIKCVEAMATCVRTFWMTAYRAFNDTICWSLTDSSSESDQIFWHELSTGGGFMLKVLFQICWSIKALKRQRHFIFAALILWIVQVSSRCFHNMFWKMICCSTSNGNHEHNFRIWQMLILTPPLIFQYFPVEIIICRHHNGQEFLDNVWSAVKKSRSQVELLRHFS